MAEGPCLFWTARQAKPHHAALADALAFWEPSSRFAALTAPPPAHALQAAHLAKLRRSAASEAHRREAAKCAVFVWAAGPVAEDDAGSAAHWQAVLQALADDRLPPKGDGSEGGWHVGASCRADDEPAHDQNT